MIECEILEQPTNGVLFYTDQQFYNSLAIFDCDTDFNLIGTDRRTCQENGEWTGQSPQCIGTKMNQSCLCIHTYLASITFGR